jgi:hypothetical protein
MKTGVEIIGWIILASIVVLLIMNADKFATVIGASTSAVVSESALLTGSGYGMSSYGSIKKAA